MLKTFTSLLVLTGLASSSWTPSPVPEVNVSMYYGRWYQVYSDLAVVATFENSSYCVIADYASNPNGTISVENRETNYNVNGPERRILGWADTADPSKPGELTVHLQTTQFGAPYWILDLGPVVNGLYDYSVVSDPFLLTLFVLTRNITRFADVYDRNVTANLRSLGFTNFLNTPIPTVQTGCIYPS